MSTLPRETCGLRLRTIFPDGVVDDPRTVSGQLAAAAVYVALYVGAVDGANQLRPSMVLWMSDDVAARAAAATDAAASADAAAWYAAAKVNHERLRRLLDEWGLTGTPWYADNSRETLRDEVFRQWQRLGAIRRDASVATTSSRPAWSLTPDFAVLFDPALTGEPLAEAITAWQAANLSTVGRTRLRLAREQAASEHSVAVKLPNGATRTLATGDSSLILRGVIEEMAPRLLAQPAVLTISQSSAKVDVPDAALLAELGLELDATELLPDAILVDVSDGRFWFVEAVASDGEIHEARRAQLEAWAVGHGIPADRCSYVTAFLSRAAPIFRRRVTSLAWGTLVWFLDEPERIVRLEDLPERTV